MQIKTEQDLNDMYFALEQCAKKMNLAILANTLHKQWRFHQEIMRKKHGTP